MTPSTSADAVLDAALIVPHGDRRCRPWARPLLLLVEIVAAVMLVTDLGVVVVSVTGRALLDAPFVWSNDVAQALLLGVSFLGAAAALAHGENAGVAFFVDRLARDITRKITGDARQKLCSTNRSP